jgi:hypothetical protein
MMRLLIGAFEALLLVACLASFYILMLVAY